MQSTHLKAFLYTIQFSYYNIYKEYIAQNMVYDITYISKFLCGKTINYKLSILETIISRNIQL